MFLQIAMQPTLRLLYTKQEHLECAVLRQRNLVWRTDDLIDFQNLTGQVKDTSVIKFP